MSLHRNATPRCSIVLTLFLFGLFALAAGDVCHAAEPSAAADAAKAPPDVIVFTNGDQLSGTFVREIGGTVTFHSDIVGDINIDWDKIKELRTQTKLAVLNKSILPKKGHIPPNVPEGTITETADMITVHPDNNAMIEPIPVKSANFIIDEATLEKQLMREPGFFAGWNGAMTAGATIVEATQKQYTFNGAVALVRVVPTVPWLDPRKRTTIDFNGSYGKITQDAYISGGVFYPATDTKSAAALQKEGDVCAKRGADGHEAFGRNGLAGETQVAEHSGGGVAGAPAQTATGRDALRKFDGDAGGVVAFRAQCGDGAIDEILFRWLPG